ncbi:hypothetical protein [Acidianus sp. HS-5]|uniref:hypothetical protein n=1 Tax=Acidianus sp. HS-5 TaxID=2886040 RepID=UPI001F18138C|nr:hypothetical protein [Acidianus sp. HS-5]
MPSSDEVILKSFSEYSSSFSGENIRNFPTTLVDKMSRYIAKTYADELLQIHDSLLLIPLDPNKNNLDIVMQLEKKYEKLRDDLSMYSSILENNTKIIDYKEMTLRGLEKLIEGLNEVRKELHEKSLKGEFNLQVLLYYSLYLEYLSKVYLKVKELKLDNPNVKTVNSKEKHYLHTVNFIVTLLGVPIIQYINEGKIFPYLSDLNGVLLYALSSDFLIPSPRSLGYYMFSKLHGD